MPKETKYPHPIGLRVDSETRAWCRLVGGERGETHGARQLVAEGIKARAAEQQRRAPLADRLEALVAELRERGRYSVSGSGAALLSAPTTEAIDALRAAGAGCIVTRSGLLVPGVTPAGADALLVLDLEAGQLAITATDGAEAVVELGEALPAVGSLAALLSSVLTRAWETVAQGNTPAEAPPGRRTDWGLVVTAAHPSDGLARIELPGAALCMHSVQLLQFAAEVFGLLARRSAEQIEIRAGLEEAMGRPAADAPAVALCWDRSHGEA